MSDSEQEIFHRVCDLAGEERAAALAEACGDDGDLRARVETLLEAHDGAGDFMAAPTTDLPNPNASKITEQAGDQIDRYKLLEAIGEGGFGVVYMAQQVEPVRRRVALKIIKLGMDTRQVVARFEAERQALAMMDHPNIAHVLDGGSTSTGRPYFVMELVRGDPITEYCDREKLSTKDRLELFQQVCHAIQHAHQKGIIHRDIKPTNVLVTVADGRPLVKVIDFGIAKATNQELTEKTLFTEFRQLIGTPQYMSPEQAERSGVDVDTRSDIYSLGVLLYEILTGRTPIDPQRLRSAQWGELQRLIRDEEPTKPSAMVTSLGADGGDIAKRRSTQVATLGGALKGDLDWIVMRALEKDRTRRYATASQLADDVGRYLVDEPVEASPPSVTYRVSKFAKRNRRMLVAVAAILGLLLAGLIGTSMATVWALRERAESAENAKEAAENAEQAADNAAKAEKAAEKAKRVASMIGLMPGLLGEAEVDRLAKAWLVDIEDMKKELGAEHKDVVRSECQHVSWLFLQGQHDVEVMRELQPRARKILGYSDPSFLSLANVHTIVQSQRKGDDPAVETALYDDVIASLTELHGEEAVVSLLPEYAWSQRKADLDEKSNQTLYHYVEVKKAADEPLKTLEMMKLDLTLNALSEELAVENPKLYAELRLIRENGRPDSGFNLAADEPAIAAAPAPASNALAARSMRTRGLGDGLKALQGKWVTDKNEDGSHMEQEIKGNRTHIQWFEKGKVVRDMDFDLKTRRENAVNILEIRMPSVPTPIQTVVYRIKDGKFYSASGFEDGPTDPIFAVWHHPEEGEADANKDEVDASKDDGKAGEKVEENADAKGASVVPAPAAFSDTVYRWEGTLNAITKKLRLQIEAEKQEDGSYQAKMISVDQGGVAIGVEDFKIADGRLSFVAKGAGAKYSGKLNDEETEAKGFFTQGLPLPLKLVRVVSFAEVEPPDRPQHPKPPYTYATETVRIENKADEIVLAGTLTLPQVVEGEDGGRFPAAILISGSGPQDRDETLFHHKPFLVIADHLTRNGVAVLRCDDRGVGESTGEFGGATSVDFARDINAAFEFLQKHKSIDATKIGLIGHSEGGIIAPLLATQRDDVAFIISLAGPGVDGSQIILTQSRAMLLAEGAPASLADAQQELFDAALKVLKEEGELTKESIDTLVDERKDRFGFMSEQMRSGLGNLSGKWMRFFLKHDPGPTWEKVRCPVLALNGERDTQVLSELNLEAIKKSLQAGGNEDFEVKPFPKLNHLFQTCRTGGLSEYAKVEETFAPAALDTMSDWLGERGLASPQATERQ